MNSPRSQVALSVKQPWATLLATGLKVIEIRRWPTSVRGPILIHASRISDERSEAWQWVTDEIRDLAGLGGGILGTADLVACHHYPDLDTFVADRSAHLNEPGWYRPPMFGFRFENARVLSFRPFSGWFKFFDVTDFESPEVVRPPEEEG